MGISYDLHNNPGTNREYVSPRLYFNALRYFLTRSGPLARWACPSPCCCLRRVQRPNGPISNWPPPLCHAHGAGNDRKARQPDQRSPRHHFLGLSPASTQPWAYYRHLARYSCLPTVDPAIWSDPFDQEKAIELFHLLRRFAGQRRWLPMSGTSVCRATISRTRPN
jgi:choline dehydrogenase